MRPVNLLPASLLAAAMAIPFASPSFASIVVTVDKSSQQMAVSVDGTPRYTWPVSTGRAGYDTPNGTYKPNRMDADHLSQEWDNAPMPHSIFFDLKGHAIHGFFDVKHLGLPVSHGCVRLAPAHAAALFSLVKAEGMADTTVIVEGHTPRGQEIPVARTRAPTNQTVSSEPMPISPGYGQPAPYYDQPGYSERRYSQPAYGQPVYGQPVYGQRYYAQPVYQPPSYGQSYYGRPVYGQQYYGDQGDQ